MEHQMTETENSLFPRGKEMDISSEVYRLYRFPKGETVMIKKPIVLIVSDNGHRVVDKEGYSHYIPYGWIQLRWKNMPERKEGFYCEAPDEMRVEDVGEQK